MVKLSFQMRPTVFLGPPPVKSAFRPETGPSQELSRTFLSAGCETFDLAENYHDRCNRRDGLSISVKRSLEPPTLYGFNGFLIEV